MLRILVLAFFIIQYFDNIFTYGQKCPQVTIQSMARYYEGFIIYNLLKIPKTNILLVNTALFSGNDITHNILYLDDISKSQDSIIDSIRTEFQITQMDFIESQNKILISNQKQLLVVDPYSLKIQEQFIYTQITGMTYLKDYGLIFMCYAQCECYIVEINSFQTIFTLNNCQYDSNPYNTYIFSKAFKQQNGVVLLIVQDGIGLCSWSFQTKTNQLQYNSYFSFPSGFINSINSYDVHDEFDILFFTGNQTQLIAYKMCHFCSQPFTPIFNQTLLNSQAQFFNIKYIKVNISGTVQQTIFTTDGGSLYRFDFQVIIDPISHQIQSLRFLNLQNPLKVNLNGQYLFQSQWYFLEENNQLIIPIRFQNDRLRTLPFIYNYNSNSIKIRHFYQTDGYSKLFRFQNGQNYYFVSVYYNFILITQDSLNGNLIQVYNIQGYAYVGNSFISVYNNPLCYITILQGNTIQLQKISFGQSQIQFGHWLNLGYLKLNKPSEMYSITAFYRQSNGQEQVWVILSLPNKQNNEQFLFHIVDMWNFQFQTLVSNNPDDNINRTCFALYSKQQQLIVGLDVKGNVYVWNALNFTDFKYKIQITQYQCLNSIIGTLNDLANGIYLIVECGDFQVISFNVVTGQTQQIIKLGSINDYIQFIQEIQLLLVYQYSTAGDIFTYLFKPSTGTFEYFMKIRVNQHLDHVINFTYLPESQMLWIQYFYADAFFEIGKCLNDPSKCLNCSIDYYFNTDESQQVDQLYGQGTIDLPFLTSKSIMSAFYDAKKYSELLYGIQNIQLNINVNPQNSMNLVQELLNIDFGAVITLNIKSMDPNNQSQVNIQNGLELQNYYSIKLDTLKLNFTIQTNGNNAAANQCGINLTNVQYSILNNLDYISSNASVNCFQIYVKNSSITISNTTIDKRNFSDVNQLISIENSNQITLNNFQLLNSILNYQFSILVQKSDTNLFIDNMVIQNNTCSSYAINPPQSVGQLFQVGQSQVSNLFIKNNSFCNQKIFSTIGNINQNNLQFIFQNITLQQNKFYIQAPYIFFNAIYYFNAVPQHNLQVQNVFSQDNIYNPTEKPNQEVSIQSTSLFFTNQINNITIQNITVQNQFEIAFSIIQLSNYVNLYNLTYKNDQEFQDNRKNNYFGGFLQFSEIQQFTLNLLNVYSINAVDNSIISINIQQYRNINMMFQNVEISNCLFNQTQSNTHSNPILITSQYYSKIQIEQCQFHDNQLIGQINSFTQSTTGFQIVSPLSDVYIQKTFFTNSKSNTLYNFAYLQCNNSYISNSIFTNSSYDLQDPISQFKQEGGFFRAKLNKLIVNNTQFINSTASKGSFLYIEPLSNSLSVYFNQTSFMQGYASMQGSAFYIDSQNSILLLNCYQCNFTNIYSFSSQSQAISIQYTETQSTILQNGIIFNNCYLTNILGQQNNYFINSVNSVLQFQGITQTQNKDLKFPQQLIDQVQNLQSQAIIQSRNSNILIQKSSFSNLYNLPNQISPLFINSTNSDLNLTNVIIQSSNFSQSLINFDLGQINIQKSQFVNISKVEKSRLLQDQQSNLVSQNYSMLILQNSNMQISDQTLFENISCYSNCYGSSINLINSTFQINETRFIHSIAEAGGAIFIQGLTSNKNTINNSSFLNNQAMKDGGALYIHAFKEDTFQLNIISSIFKDNQCNEGQGGAIMIKSDSNNSTQQSIYINNSFFSENQAQIGGAIQNLGIHPFIDSSNIIKNNIANLYGSDISSYPTSLFLQNQAELKDNGSFQKIILNDFKSGGNLPNFIFQLRDGSNKTVIQQNNQILSAQVQVSSKTQNSTQYYVRGNSQINIDQAKHIFNFSNLQLIGIPKSSSVIQFTSDSIKIYNNYTNQYDSNYTFDVYVNFRNCQTGEIINKYNNFQECQTCENGKYSLDYTSCYPCPNGAQCSNGIINLESGFWREEEFSPDIFECINRKENCVQSSFGNSVCVTGNIGPLCEECDIYGKFWGESYTRQSKYQCTKCKSIKSDLWKLFLSVLWIFISLHITVRNDREYQLSKILIQSIIRKRPVSNSSMSYLLRNILIQKSYIKIFTNYIQIISIVASFNLNFKSDLLDFASALGIPVSTSIDFFDCFLKDLNSQVPIIYIKLIISIQQIRKPLKLKIQKALLTFSSFSKDQKQFLLSLYQTQENRIQIGQTSDQNKLLQTKNTKSNYLEQFFQDNKIKSLNSPQSHSYLLNLDLSKSPYFFNKNVGLKENIISQENIPICQKDFFTTEKDQKNEMNFSNLIYQAHLAKINQESLFQSHSYQNQLLNKADKSSANQQGESNIQLNQIQYINDSESQKDRTQPMNVTQTIKYFKDNQNMGVDQEQKEHQLSTFSSQKQSKVVSNKQNPFNQFSKIQQIQADNEDEILINEKEQKTQTNQLIQTHQTFKTNQEINTESNYDKKESIVKVNEIEHIQDTEQLKDSIQPFNQSGQIQRLETKQIQEIDLILNKNKIDALNQQNQCLKKQNEQNPFNDFSKINQIQADIDDDILIASQNIVEEKQV
ncbi:hypothetical protein ABPG74_013368 [Tetrahymena malaccensis]